ncbi:MAG: Wzy polymerase domain-containing protein [Caldimonas sp.]
MQAARAIAQGVTEADEPVPPWAIALCASLAVATPTLIAFNVPPSATFFNQAAALVGWGGFMIVLGACVPRSAWPRSPAALALLAAMTLIAISALSASIFDAVPSTLSLSAVGTILPAVLVVAVAASVQRAGLGEFVFRAFSIGLVVAGVASTAIGLLQVFAPGAADGDWIAIASIAGRATGNLRQPNHLSSLLLWSVVAAVWLGEAKALNGRVAVALAIAFIYVVVLSASRTGALGMATLAAWGLLDRRLSRRARVVLALAPLLYAAMYWATSAWAAHSQQVFGGQARFGKGIDLATNRYDVWSNTLSLIASHPWFGVGFGDFNFAWTLTPFPNRPTEFFDHTHNVILNFAVEMGVPLAAVVIGLLVYALWRALGHAIRDGREPAEGYPVQRAAFVIVFLVAVHSMLEYPLWYAYFLLPTAFAFGLCVERPVASEAAARAGEADPGNVTRPYVIAAMFLILGGTLAVYDYMRVVVIFAPPAGAGSLEQRIADGKKSVLFGHHADYAAATVAEHPGTEMKAFERAPHYLLDSRLMTAWAKALDEQGESDKARYVAARLKEFRNDQTEEFFAPCRPGVPASGVEPFQCQAPARPLRFEDFRH